MKTFHFVNGDLTIGPGGFATIDGPRKVIQDLGMIVREPLAADRFHPLWGSILDDFIGYPISLETEAKVRAEIHRLVQNYMVAQSNQITADVQANRRPRYRPDEIVVGVGSVNIQQYQDRINVKVVIETQDGGTFDLFRTIGNR